MEKTFEIKDFDLEETLNSAQFFSFEKKRGNYYIIHADKVFRVRQEADKLVYSGIDEIELRSFFSLDDDLKELVKDFNDEFLLAALRRHGGLRVMRTDLWQTMIAFVCSSAANVSKIKMNMRLLSEAFGENVSFEGDEFHLFPKPGSMGDMQKILDAKTGYRAKFIYDINKMIKEDPALLERIRNMNYVEAKAELIKLPGIGPKVADCICLFGLGHKEAFPVDTWVIQMIERFYLKRKSKNIKEITIFIEEYFKDNRGIKQQYLFHYMRNLK